jgi:hypothetical protein
MGVTGSPKTTLLGLMAGLFLFFGAAAKDRATNPQAPPITLNNTLPALAVTILGALAQDHKDGQ